MPVTKKRKSVQPPRPRRQEEETPRQQEEAPSQQEELGPVGWIITLVVLALVGWGSYRGLTMALDAVATKGAPWTHQVALLLLLMAAAISATFYKRWNQFSYGLAEMLFGALSAWRVMQQQFEANHPLDNGFLLIGSMYFMARATQNILEGRAKQ